MQKLFLIDANSLIHRTFHALPPLVSKSGKPTGSLYGLASILISLFREDLEFCAALFDRPEPTLRKKEFEAYKAQRPKAPDELIAQIIEAHNLFSNFGIKYFEKPGFEADDLIASLAKKFKNENLQIIILTGDRDTFQLVDDKKVIVRILKKGISQIEDYDENKIIEKFQILPNQIVDFKALIGDPSDNIPGVSSIGPKTAIELIKSFGSLEGIYKNLDKITKFKDKLIQEKENVFFYRKLVKLYDDLELDINLNDLKINLNKEQLINYFKELGFESLIQRLNKNNNADKDKLKKNIKESKYKNLKQATIF
jgi:DNA polymerase-1